MRGDARAGGGGGATELRVLLDAGMNGFAAARDESVSAAPALGVAAGRAEDGARWDERDEAAFVRVRAALTRGSESGGRRGLIRVLRRIQAGEESEARELARLAKAHGEAAPRARFMIKQALGAATRSQLLQLDGAEAEARRRFLANKIKAQARALREHARLAAEAKAAEAAEAEAARRGTGAPRALPAIEDAPPAESPENNGAAGTGKWPVHARPETAAAFLTEPDGGEPTSPETDAEEREGRKGAAVRRAPAPVPSAGALRRPPCQSGDKSAPPRRTQGGRHGKIAARFAASGHAASDCKQQELAYRGISELHLASLSIRIGDLVSVAEAAAGSTSRTEDSRERHGKVRFAFDRVKDHQRLMARHIVAIEQLQPQSKQPESQQQQPPPQHKQQLRPTQHQPDLASRGNRAVNRRSVGIETTSRDSAKSVTAATGSGGSAPAKSKLSAPGGPPQYLAKRLAMLSSEEWLLNNIERAGERCRFDELSAFD